MTCPRRPQLDFSRISRRRLVRARENLLLFPSGAQYRLARLGIASTCAQSEPAAVYGFVRRRGRARIGSPECFSSHITDAALLFGYVYNDCFWAGPEDGFLARPLHPIIIIIMYNKIAGASKKCSGPVQNFQKRCRRDCFVTLDSYRFYPFRSDLRVWGS